MQCCAQKRNEAAKSIQTASYQRWWCLIGGLLLELVGGSAYGFGSFSHQLSEKLGGLSDSEIEFIAICGNVGLWTNLIGSIVYNQIGIRATIIGGSGLVVVGYLLMYFAINSLWPYWVVGIIWFFVGHGSGWMFVAAMFNNAKNFDTSSRGLVVGLLAAHFGMSSSLFVSFISSCFGGTYVIKNSGLHMHNGAGINTTTIASNNFTTAECQGGFVGNNIEHYMLLAGAVVLVFTVIACSLGMIRKPLSSDLLAQVAKSEDKKRTIHRLAVLLGLTCAALITLASMNVMSLKFPEVLLVPPPTSNAIVYTWP